MDAQRVNDLIRPQTLENTHTGGATGGDDGRAAPRGGAT